MVVATTQHHLTLHLDTRIPLEAMVLQRMKRLPLAKQDEWLRQLLLEGFRSECQVMKSSSRPVYGMSTQQIVIAPETKQQPVVASAERKAPHVAASAGFSNPNTTETKPFTHLRHILGE
jgi:hypothetical protein